MDIGLYQFGSRVSPALKRRMTSAALQSLGFSDNTKESLNWIVKGVANILADHFREGADCLTEADLLRSRFCSSFRTSAVWVSASREKGLA
jgi:hypothetical protein